MSNDGTSVPPPVMPFAKGEQVFFSKSGKVVEVIGWQLADNMTFVVKTDSGKQMLATEHGLQKLGPFGCLCQTLHHRMVGDGCCLCENKSA
jgi:hypothetical protein